MPQEHNNALAISIFIEELNEKGIQGRAVFDAVIERCFPEGVDWETLAYFASQYPALSLKAE